MYLHIIVFDRKFPAVIRRLFEAADPLNHRYVIVNTDVNFSLGSDFVSVSSAAELGMIINSRTDWQGVILNGILASFEPYLSVLPSDLKIAWVVWGCEIYGYKYIQDAGLLEQKTHKFVYGDPSSNFKIAMRPLWLRLRGHYTRMRRVLKRVNFVVTHLQEEYDLFRSWGFLSPGNQWHQAPVLLLSDTVGLSNPISEEFRPDIQVGNSATQTNNHVDVFYRLSQIDLSGRRVIVPLSYGHQKYREYVVTEGERLLGKHFVPILEFMPLAEYSECLSTCGIVILNHYRQQAVANAVAALWEGRHLYLGPSTVYQNYYARGLPVYSLSSEFDLNREEMSIHEVLEVREHLSGFLGDSVAIGQARRLLERLESQFLSE